MKKIEKIKLPIFEDDRGILVPIEIKDYLDFPIKRVYYVTEVTKPRGGHAVKFEKKMYVCQKGKIKARFHDGKEWQEFQMEGPADAIIMKDMCFRDFTDFSPDAVLMAISSVNYVPDDYIYDLDEFIKYVN